MSAQVYNTATHTNWSFTPSGCCCQGNPNEWVLVSRKPFVVTAEKIGTFTDWLCCRGEANQEAQKAAVKLFVLDLKDYDASLVTIVLVHLNIIALQKNYFTQSGQERKPVLDYVADLPSLSPAQVSATFAYLRQFQGLFSGLKSKATDYLSTQLEHKEELSEVSITRTTPPEHKGDEPTQQDTKPEWLNAFDPQIVKKFSQLETLTINELFYCILQEYDMTLVTIVIVDLNIVTLPEDYFTQAIRRPVLDYLLDKPPLSSLQIKHALGWLDKFKLKFSTTQKNALLTIDYSKTLQQNATSALNLIESQGNSQIESTEKEAGELLQQQQVKKPAWFDHLDAALVDKLEQLETLTIDDLLYFNDICLGISQHQGQLKSRRTASRHVSGKSFAVNVPSPTASPVNAPNVTAKSSS